VTVRRLREDVDWALAPADIDPASFRQSGGLPPEARRERGTAAGAKGRTACGDGWEREIGAQHTAGETETATGIEQEIGARPVPLRRRLGRTSQPPDALRVPPPAGRALV
jgi:hypothetical protein